MKCWISNSYFMFTDEWVRNIFLQKPTSVQTMFNLKKCKLNSNICIELMTAVVVVMRWVKRINIGGLLSNHLSNNRKNNNGTFSFHSSFLNFDRGCCKPRWNTHKVFSNIQLLYLVFFSHQWSYLIYKVVLCVINCP